MTPQSRPFANTLSKARRHQVRPVPRPRGSREVRDIGFWGSIPLALLRDVDVSALFPTREQIRLSVKQSNQFELLAKHFCNPFVFEDFQIARLESPPVPILSMLWIAFRRACRTPPTAPPAATLRCQSCRPTTALYSAARGDEWGSAQIASNGCCARPMCRARGLGRFQRLAGLALRRYESRFLGASILPQIAPFCFALNRHPHAERRHRLHVLCQ